MRGAEPPHAGGAEERAQVVVGGVVLVVGDEGVERGGVVRGMGLFTLLPPLIVVP